MKQLILFFSLLLLIMPSTMAQEEDVALKTETGTIEGTLLVPESKGKVPVALIISGSGETDRNGNNPVMMNNSLKMLAEGLLENNIASLRYDKRGVGQSADTSLIMSEMSFDTYIKDAEDWVALLAKDERFGDITVMGLSEGAQISGIVAQQETVAKFVSMAGGGEAANKTIRRQLETQLQSMPDLLKESLSVMSKIENGEKVEEVNPMLAALFSPDLQPYLISWFKYDPQKEIAKVDKPILIVQGTTDIQVMVEDAKKLAEGNPKAQLEIIEGMNHVLKESELDQNKNLATYNQPDLPLKEGLLKVIVEFINK